MREVDGYDEVQDYLMSEKFGLGWKDHDSVRMITFQQIMGYYAKRQERDGKKQERKYGRC